MQVLALIRPSAVLRFQLGTFVIVTLQPAHYCAYFNPDRESTKMLKQLARRLELLGIVECWKSRLRLELGLSVYHCLGRRGYATAFLLKRPIFCLRRIRRLQLAARFAPSGGTNSLSRIPTKIELKSFVARFNSMLPHFMLRREHAITQKQP